MSKKQTTIILAMVLSVILSSADGLAATASKLNRIRSWQHKGYTRLVLDAEGAQPLKIGPSTAEGVIIVFKQLALMQTPSVLFDNLTGAVAGVNHHRQAHRSVIAINFRTPHTTVKSFYLAAKSAKKGAYRLIMDLYPPGSAAAGPGQLVPVATARTAIPAPTPAPAPAAAPTPRVAAAARKMSLPAAESTQQFAEIQSKAPQTASPSPTEKGELASGEQKQGVPPAESVPSTESVPLPESPAISRAKGEKQNVSKLHQSETTLKMSVMEPSANRKEPREGNDQTMAALKSDITMAAKPDHIPAAQMPHSGTNDQPPGVVEKAASGAPAPNDIASHFKNPGARRKGPDTTGQPTSFGVEARSVSISPAVEEKAIPRRSVSYERKDPVNKQTSMGLVALTLKLLSIILSCLVILFLYRANKIETHRYQALKQIQQRLDNQRPPTELSV